MPKLTFGPRGMSLVLRDGQKVPLVRHLAVADGIWSRLWGLMGQKELPQGCGLLLSPCNNIHMFFVRFPIDVLYLDREMRIVAITRGIKPWRIDRPVLKAHHTLELPSGTLETIPAEIGMQAIIE